MRTTAVLLALSAAAAVASCNGDGLDRPVLARSAIPAELPGCYEIAPDSSAAAPLPPGALAIRQGRDTIELLRTVPADSAVLTMGMYPWSVDSLADSIRVSTPVGTMDGGLTYVLGFRLGSDTLRGRLVLHSDRLPNPVYDGDPVWAFRIRCRNRAASVSG